MSLFVAYLSFPVHTDDTSSRLMGRGHKDGLTADTVHVDTGCCLYVVQVDVAVLGDEEDDVVFGAHLGERRK